MREKGRRTERVHARKREMRTDKRIRHTHMDVSCHAHAGDRVKSHLKIRILEKMQRDIETWRERETEREEER